MTDKNTGGPALKPCPFCGGVADILGSTETTIRCRECLSLGQPRWDRELSIAAWNRRHASETERAREDVISAARALVRETIWADGQEQKRYRGDAVAMLERALSAAEGRGSR